MKEELPTAPAFPQQHWIHHSYDRNGNLAWTSLASDKGDPAVVAADNNLVTKMAFWDPGGIRTSDDPANPLVLFDYRPEGWR